MCVDSEWRRREMVSSLDEVANHESEVGLLLFDVATNECKTIPFLGRSCNVDVFNYVESLVPLVKTNIQGP